MRARVAYISSFGTTTILVGAALLMLAVGSALVAFHGWPGFATNSGVESVPLTAAPAPHRAARVSRASRAPALARARAARAAARRPLSTSGLVKGAPARASVVPGIVMLPAPASIAFAPPPGARYPSPARPPFQPPAAPRRPQTPGPVAGPDGPVQFPLPGPSGAPDPGQVETMVGEALGSAPPAPVLPAIPGLPGVGPAAVMTAALSSLR